ncbi:MAG TPA: N,N-dimethylformamidase beta subunit family domain-containing protein [Streptosporangiaceae bacterium]|nr:N,N-dimethylformamidase beta subunit family domain-containing protein [Streptosporangiaceae bacterium]
MDLLGYAQPCVAHPGQTVEVKVSTTLAEFTAEVVRLDLGGQPVVPQPVVPQPAGGRYPGRRQDLVSGSYLVAEPGEAQPLAGGCTVQLWFCPTLLAGQPQCLMSGRGAGGGWELFIGTDGRLAIARLSASGTVLSSLPAGTGLVTGRWYFAAATWDAAGAATLVIVPRDPGGGRAGLTAAVGQQDLGGPMPGAAVITVGAALSGGRPRCCFNGKIDTPRVFVGVVTMADLDALAADAPAARIGGLRHEWLLGPEAALPPHRVRDAGPGRCDGTLINQPTLGVTGRNWIPGTESFAASPQEYRAAHFHEDDLSDAGWDTDLSFQVPAGWRSGVYGIRLRAGEHEDTVPLIVTAADAPGGAPGGASSATATGRRRSAVAVLLPTFSYLAYANEHASWEHPIKSSAAEAAAMPVTGRDRSMARHRLLSLYELHADGSGNCLSSWRRPVLNMRPGYHLPLIRGPHQFSADLELLHWLERRQVEFDVITDDDLHRRGAAALAPYRVVLTGSHPEYTSTQMLDGLDSYLASAGRLMYLGGNGFYWVTTAPEDDPYVIEVRRGMAGTRVWESPPGECHHAMTGERGGLWRLRGRGPQALAGVGFTAQGFDRSLPYRIEAGQPGDRTGFILDGIDAGAPLDGLGSVLGGPAGFEIDRADAALGTPPGAVLVASASGFSDSYQGAVEDIMTADSRQGGTACDLVRSDVVFFETPAGGAVFSVGSIAWCGALEAAGEQTPVGQMTWNVLSRFLDEAPFDYPAVPAGTGGK